MKFTLIPKSTPIIIRKCARCEQNRFASSDKFRVNANKKVIDVWLIYKCLSCENTLNVSILTRKSVASIDRKLLEGFHMNDRDLAWQYAFDPNFLEKGLQVDWAIDFEVEAEAEAEVEAEAKAEAEAERYSSLARGTENKTFNQTSCFLIHSRFFLKTSISIVLRKVLEISRNQLDKKEERGEIEILSFQGKALSLKNAIGFGCSVKVIKI